MGHDRLRRRCRVKAGPGFQKASGSSLVAVMSRNGERARDFARRHGVPRVHATVAELIADPDVDAVYIATPPASHCELAMAVAAARKPCLVEKPMSTSYADCTRMRDAFASAGVPLWVAFYRRALPRFLLVRDLLRDDEVGEVTSAQIELMAPIPSAEVAASWRFNPAIGGAGLFFDMGSHCVDLIDFLLGPIEDARGFARNTAGAYRAEDLVAAVFRTTTGVCGTGVWNFNAGRSSDRMTLTGTHGSIAFAVFADSDIIVNNGNCERRIEGRFPPHVHQPLIQSIVDELRGRGSCPSTAESGARATNVMEQCVAEYYGQLPTQGS